MITLRWVRLVNWHYFRDETLRIGERSLISGDNGMGKSTIVDAIQYALAADLRKARFNQAAGDRRGGRDLVGYVRCKIGSDTTEYLRGDTVSHVMLQFEANDEAFTAAVCVEAFSDGRCTERFWISQGIGVDSISVHDGKNKPLTWRQFKDGMDGAGTEFHESKREYLRSLTNRLGVFRRMSEYNPYLEAFTRSVSFTPLVSVDRFVCDYILEERAVDIRTMKDNLESYKEAERHANATIRKIEVLRTIGDMAEEYRKLRANLTRQDYLKRLVDRIIISDQLTRNAEKDRDTEQLLHRLSSEIERNGKDRERLGSELREVDAALARDDNHNLYRRLQDRVRSLEHESEESERKALRCALLRKQCAALLDAARRTEGSDASARSSAAPEDEEALVDHEIGLMEEARSAAERESNETRDALAAAEAALRDRAAELADLERGIRRFPENSRRLVDELKGRGIEAWILAELADVTNPDWADAVEGWLNTLRFAVVVAPDSFQEALEIYDAQPRSLGGVALPNIAKLRERAGRIRKGSLAELTASDNPWAGIYLNAILGEVMGADIASLKNYDKAITRECMSYSNHTATRVKEEVYREHWLGRAAREKRLRFLNAEVARLRAERVALAEREREATDRSKAFAQGVRSLYEAKQLVNAAAESRRLIDEIAAAKNEIAAIDISQSRDLAAKSEELSRRIAVIGEDRDRLTRDHARAQADRDNLAERASDLRAEAVERERDFESFRNAHEAELADCEAYTADRLKTEPAERIAGTWAAARKGIETRAENTLASYRKRVNEYGNQFNEMVSVEIEDCAALLETLERLEHSELPVYRDRIIRARQDAEKEFREHFIAKLNEYILEARESFREINATLKTLSFGNDQYSFTLEERADRRGQIRIVQKAAEITSYDGGLFEQLVNPDERRQTEALFDSIVHADLDSAELRSICDYRTYFSYDIRIRDTQSMDPATGKAIDLSLSRVLREKSGGEAQTPYYVAIAASFYRFFKDKPDDSIRFVLFDEAFDKLDDERIRKVIDFYAQMGIQLMVAVPPGKIEAIAPLSDQICVVSRVGQDARVRDFRSIAGGNA